MHHWLIERNSYWLCDACVRDLADAIIGADWQWIEVRHDDDRQCDRCRCTDPIATRFGRWRFLLRWLAVIPRLLRPGRTTAARHHI